MFCRRIHPGSTEDKKTSSLFKHTNQHIQYNVALNVSHTVSYDSDIRHIQYHDNQNQIERTGIASFIPFLFLSVCGKAFSHFISIILSNMYRTIEYVSTLVCYLSAHTYDTYYFKRSLSADFVESHFFLNEKA